MTSDAAPPPSPLPLAIGPRRLHFAAAVGEALGALRDVAVPLLIGLVVRGTGSSTSAILIGLAGALGAAVIGTIRWQATSYAVTDRALHFKSGVFSPDETVVPLQRIQAVDTVTGPVQRLFGVSGLHVQTPGGGEDGDVVLPALSRRAAARLRAALGHPDTGTAGLHVRLTAGRLVAAALTSPQLGVLLPVVGGAFGLLQSSSMAEGVRLLRDIDTWHQVLVALALLLAAAFLVSFLGALIAFSGFEVRMVDDRLRIRRGFWERRAVSVPLARIDGVQIVSSPLRRPFGLVALRLEATSLGEREAVGRTLFPLMRQDEVGPFLARVAPELAGPLTTTERPPRRALRRFLTARVAIALALSAVLVALAPSAWPAAPALIAIAIVFGIDAYNLAGLRVDGPRVVLRTRRLGSRVTLIARRRRLQSHALSRTPFQRHAGLATLAVTVARGTRVHVRHLERPPARRAFDEL
ncbi:MAG TPA: PH domain-containing protein [Baekduia sp.]|uniref:PH domain-containing protein n=1 Tax=Baekduia sp. TaxID=2600305 RepID=UPI002D778E59|nr:PH domain-containing protein [Baekduia sp.]HET6508716.1 PH domain-containing protein [Baekduia sp.]